MCLCVHDKYDLVQFVIGETFSFPSVLRQLGLRTHPPPTHTHTHVGDASMTASIVGTQPASSHHFE